MHSFEGVPRWQLVPHLWEASWVNITCQGLQVVEVYTSRTWQTLISRVREDRRASCGWRRLLRIRTDSCQTPVSPFGQAYVAVKHPGSSASIRGQQCSFQLEQDFSYVLLGMGVAGALLFLFSTPLSTSQPFRLSAGTLGFMALSVAILLVFISRHLPSKKSVVVAFGIFGSSFAAVMQSLFGRWIPSYHQLIYSPWVLGYLVVTGLLGLALTYYYDDAGNHKLQTILRVALQLVGLGLVAISTTLPEASAGLCCLLILLRLTPALLPFWHQASEAVEEQEIQQQRAQQLQAEESGPEARARLRKSYPAGRQGHEQENEDDERGHGARHRSYWFGQPRDSPREEARPAASQSPALRRHTDVGPRGTSDVTSSHLDTSGAPSGGWGMSGHSPPHAGNASRADLQQPVSPLVQKGYVINSRTGKVINMERSTYSKLVAQGYQLDRAQGTLTPPSKADAPGRSQHAHSSHDSLPSPSHMQQSASPSGTTNPGSAHRKTRGSRPL
ncbi:hypothetical protein WJX84_006268 [Apatococcus fuscideae]|uniref:Uncharacterized protein n=1 Tax=Apatococcus fuscideae TaxID=2026836 RepID=A0AAW1STI4_9CHLO